MGRDTMQREPPVTLKAGDVIFIPADTIRCRRPSGRFLRRSMTPLGDGSEFHVLEVVLLHDQSLAQAPLRRLGCEFAGVHNDRKCKRECMAASV